MAELPPCKSTETKKTIKLYPIFERKYPKRPSPKEKEKIVSKRPKKSHPKIPKSITVTKETADYDPNRDPDYVHYGALGTNPYNVKSGAQLTDDQWENIALAEEYSDAFWEKFRRDTDPFADDSVYENPDHPPMIFGP